MKGVILKGVVFTMLLVPAWITQAQVIPDDPGNFITTWNTENPGNTGNNQIRIPGTGGGYNYEIYWEEVGSSTNNGTTSVITTDSYVLTFPSPGIYEVQIAGTFPRIFFNRQGDRRKILTVEQWGTNAWTSMRSAFAGASNLRVPATDAPDLSAVTDMHHMLFQASSFNDPIDHWDVSNVQDMNHLLRETSFNQPLNNWDVSRVQNFNEIFNDTPFNQSLNDWNTASGTTMTYLFAFGDFNGDISDWDVSNVTELNNMFRRSPFNQDISSWEISPDATNLGRMFKGNGEFNQDISGWDVSNITNFSQMFDGRRFDGQHVQTSFDQDLSPWDISSATNMSGMFRNGNISQANLDATLAGWAAQTVQPNVSLHIGTANYSSVGALAIQELENTYNWNITEQYRAEYWPGENAALIGDNIQVAIDSGASTTPVTLNPSEGCTFIQWSDGNTDNPRVDTPTANINVTAEVSCPSSGSSGTRVSRSTGSRAESSNNQSSSQNTTKTETLEETLSRVEEVPDKIISIRADNPSDETSRELVQLLKSLVESLKQLLLLQETSPTPLS